MTYSTRQVSDSQGAPQAADGSICRRGSLALVALRARYGLVTPDATTMDRLTALRVAATLEFLHNNLPDTL